MLQIGLPMTFFMQFVFYLRASLSGMAMTDAAIKIYATVQDGPIQEKMTHSRLPKEIKHVNNTSQRQGRARYARGDHQPRKKRTIRTFH